MRNFNQSTGCFPSLELWEMERQALLKVTAPKMYAPFAEFPSTIELVGIFYDELSDFHFIPGRTPLSTIKEVTTAIITYLVIIFTLQQFMKNRKPFQLKNAFIAHNIALSAGSFILLAFLLKTIVPGVVKNGVFWGICSAEIWEGNNLELFYYINYLFKYYELLDTVFLVLKKKPLEFLHVYHHALTAVLCFSQLVGKTSVQWVPITLNLFVHVVMYYYYAMAAAGHRIWWKKYLTTLQITQFVIDIVAVYFCMLTEHSQRGIISPVFNFGKCEGSAQAGFFGCALLTSYLYLFIEFFTKAYSAPQPSASKEVKKPQPAVEQTPVHSS